MIARLLLLLLLVAAPALAVSTQSADVVDKKLTGVSITTTEDTLTLTLTDPSRPRIITLVSDVEWGISTATGTYASKFIVPAKQAFTLKLSEASKTYYIQSATTSGTVHPYVLTSRPQE